MAAGADGPPSHLDFASPSFDALRALYDPHVRPPREDVAPLDGVSKCAALLPEWMLPPELVVKLRKRVEETDSGVRAAVQELESMQAAAARGARQDAARRTRLLDAVRRKLAESAEGSAAAAALCRLADERSRVAVIVGGPGAGEGGHLVVWTGVLLSADAQWNVLLGGSVRYLVGRDPARPAPPSAPQPPLRVDPATGAVTGAPPSAPSCWESVSAVLEDGDRGAWAEASGQTLLRGAVVQAVLRHPKR